MENILVLENTGFCDDGCEFTTDWLVFAIILILLLVLICICGIRYVYRGNENRPKINENKQLVPRCENKIMHSFDVITIKSIEIHYDIGLYLILKIRIACITRIDIYAGSAVEINQPIGQIIPSIGEKKLICYCDGSYSHYMQIGYAGFRASNGAIRILSFSPCEPRYGSTDTEVLAACLAIQYALEKQYNSLIIYTDNSKVEQLLKRPKKKDSINYPDICQILNQYQKQKGDNAIQVIRVRGHTSIDEQRKCKIKHEFAKIDRIVRRKMRQYIKRWWIYFEQNYYHWYKPVCHSYYTWLGCYT